jgi:hypothetical protein
MKLKSPRTLDARTLVRPRSPVPGVHRHRGLRGHRGVAGSPAHRLEAGDSWHWCNDDDDRGSTCAPPPGGCAAAHKR